MGHTWGRTREYPILTYGMYHATVSYVNNCMSPDRRYWALLAFCPTIWDCLAFFAMGRLFQTFFLAFFFHVFLCLVSSKDSGRPWMSLSIPFPEFLNVPTNIGGLFCKKERETPHPPIPPRNSHSMQFVWSWQKGFRILSFNRHFAPRRLLLIKRNDLLKVNMKLQCEAYLWFVLIVQESFLCAICGRNGQKKNTMNMKWPSLCTSSYLPFDRSILHGLCSCAALQWIFPGRSMPRCLSRSASPCPA